MCICRFKCPVCNAHAPYCYLLPACLYNIFPHYLINATIPPPQKKILEQKTYVLIFCTAFIWNVPHSKKNWARYDQKCMKSTRYFCPVLKKLEILQHICERHSNIKFHENHFSESCVVLWRRTYRRIRRPDEAHGPLCNFANAPKKHSMHETSASPIGASRRRWIFLLINKYDKI